MEPPWKYGHRAANCIPHGGYLGPGPMWPWPMWSWAHVGAIWKSYGGHMVVIWVSYGAHVGVIWGHMGSHGSHMRAITPNPDKKLLQSRGLHGGDFFDRPKNSF